MPGKLLIVQAAGLGYHFLNRHHGLAWSDLTFRPLESVFPALTCTAQATFRTATHPSSHGMVANGLYHRALNRALFWEQSSSLVTGPRLWAPCQTANHKVAMLFWQQSLGESVDMLLSPAPIHTHGGGMIDAMYSLPPSLHDNLCRHIGRRFRLHRYWGPLASSTSSGWIASATAALLLSDSPPDLCLTYLPALDYDLQRFGPDHPRARRALSDLLTQLDTLRTATRKTGHDLLIYGDYAIAPVSSAAFPNRLLREQGFLRTRSVKGMAYPDLPASRAFALVDHEIAHVYIRNPADIPAVQAALTGVPGIASATPRAEVANGTLAHPNSGEIILTASDGYWFAYPWWTTRKETPDYAGHVDIHNKPGYDPCELFFGWPPGTVSQDTTRIRGSHGRTGPGREVAWAATFTPHSTPATLVDLAHATSQWLEAGP
jgi:predicted AlkP superfamily pyrophosphatase or phosphodiesterase